MCSMTPVERLSVRKHTGARDGGPPRNRENPPTQRTGWNTSAGRTKAEPFWVTPSSSLLLGPGNSCHLCSRSQAIAS